MESQNANANDGSKDGASGDAVVRELSLIPLLNSVFACEKPRHIIAGICDAVQDICVGTGLGVASLVAVPVVNGMNSGATGALKGFGIGMITCLGMTTYGAMRGAKQLLLGGYNTFDAVKSMADGGKYWDGQEGRCVDVNLQSDLEQLPVTDDDLYAQAREEYEKLSSLLPPAGTNDSPPGAPASSSASAGGNDHYSALGVSRTATADEIRSAFRRKALELHPDKNPNNPEAALRFREVMEANNVLSDEGRRAYYDKHGSEAAVPEQSSSFSQLEESLGANFMEIFIGRVSLALYFIPNIFVTGKLKREFRKRRTLRLARQLLRFVDDGENGLSVASDAIRDAVAARVGRKLMPLVAKQYMDAARQHLYENTLLRELDSFFTGKVSTLSRIADMAKTCVPTATKAAVKTLDEDDRVDVLIALCEGDVEQTVLQASLLILFDTSVSKEQRKRRAENLSRLGRLVKNACFSAQVDREK